MPKSISVRGDVYTKLKDWCKDNDKQMGPLVDNLVTNYMDSRKYKKK